MDLHARVILVDDDPNTLKLLQYTFRDDGYDVETATNGEEALHLLNERDTDLIITDVMMPVMDGFELCRSIRNESRWQTLPFIFLSARGSTDDRVTGLSLGADDYVVKPFDRRELLVKARTLLNRVRIYRDHPVEQNTPESAPIPFPAPNPAGPDIHKPQKPVRVLIVDDELPMRKLVEVNLRKAGFVVSTAANGTDAIEQVEKSTPDLIISDVLMPVMDGMQLRKELLERSDYRSIPFLFLTAKGQPEDMLNALRMGVDDYLTKPVIPQVLIQKVRNLVDKNHASAERYRAELEQAAAKVSAHLEPDAPVLDGIIIAQRSEPLEIRGGDYCDYIELKNGRYAMVVGDVMGKKWGAWFFSVAYIAYLRSVIRAISSEVESPSPAAIVRRVNQLLWEDLKVSEVFTTVYLAIIDPERREITFTNAAHPPTMHYIAASDKVHARPETGLILGVQPDFDYEDTTISLAPGDMIVTYSDGITEAFDQSGQLYGEDRLIQIIQRNSHADINELVNSVFADVDSFSNGSKPEDDRTLAILRAL
jgi:phosphoserine phosphatase RsbU/P